MKTKSTYVKLLRLPWFTLPLPVAFAITAWQQEYLTSGFVFIFISLAVHVLTDLKMPYSFCTTGRMPRRF